MPLIPTQEPPYYEISDTPDTGGIKQYIALLSQTGTAPPTNIILKNTLGDTTTWYYDSTGKYSMYYDGTGSFDELKTTVTITPYGNGNLTSAHVAGDAINIENQDITDASYADNGLVYNTITITVYP